MDATATVEVTNIPYAITKDSAEREFAALALGVAMISVSIPPRAGKARVEVQDQNAAAEFVRAVSGKRIGGRNVRAELVRTAANNQAFVQSAAVRRWGWQDSSAEPRAKQDQRNDDDMTRIFDTLPHGPLRDSLVSYVARETASGDLVLKEIYLAQGRTCELVFSQRFGGPDVRRSNELTDEDHLKDFMQLFQGLPDDVRRTGINDTLHRISRSVHAIQKKVVAITARVGRMCLAFAFAFACLAFCARRAYRYDRFNRRLAADLAACLARRLAYDGLFSASLPLIHLRSSLCLLSTGTMQGGVLPMLCNSNELNFQVNDSRV